MSAPKKNNSQRRDRKKKDVESKEDMLARWSPRTSLGKMVKEGKITSISEILDSGKKILEEEIIDTLIPNLESDLLLIGQSKGKFGGGQRRIFRQTQKKTMEGNKPSFATVAIVGNRNGYVGIGYGKSRETVPAREKALRQAKLNIMKIRRGSGSWQSTSREAHSIPFMVAGRCGSISVRLIPAPKGTGLVVGSEIKKILELAGVKDVWSKLIGHSKSRVNVIYAVEDALQHLIDTKTTTRQAGGFVEGEIRST